MSDFIKLLQERINNKDNVWQVKVIPSSSYTKIVDIMSDGTVKIRVAAAPENNRANKELVKFLEKNFGKQVKIISGEKAKLKKVKLIDFL